MIVRWEAISDKTVRSLANRTGSFSRSLEKEMQKLGKQPSEKEEFFLEQVRAGVYRNPRISFGRVLIEKKGEN